MFFILVSKLEQQQQNPVNLFCVFVFTGFFGDISHMMIWCGVYMCIPGLFQNMAVPVTPTRRHLQWTRHGEEIMTVTLKVLTVTKRIR